MTGRTNDAMTLAEARAIARDQYDLVDIDPDGNDPRLWAVCVDTGPGPATRTSTARSAGSPTS